jgi:hypothetical protein
MADIERLNYLQPPDSPGFDWYVDSEDGSDAHTGKTPSQAFQSIAKLLTVMEAGQSTGLKRGSLWREQLSLPGAGCRVGAYGGGERPILDASDEIAGGAWSKTAGRTYVYQCSITPAWSGNDWLNAFEDGAFLSRAVDLSTCDATPGSYFPSGSSGTITLYVHPTGNGNPASNGKTYEYSARPNGIDFYNHANCRVSGVHTRKQLNCDGSLRAGQGATLVNCLASYGGKHNLYFRTGRNWWGWKRKKRITGRPRSRCLWATRTARTARG